MNPPDYSSPERLSNPDQLMRRRISYIFNGRAGVINIQEIRRARAQKLSTESAARTIVNTEVAGSVSAPIPIVEAKAPEPIIAAVAPIPSQAAEQLPDQPVGDELAERRRREDEARRLANQAHGEVAA